LELARTRSDEILVVGAGLSGLTAAAEIAGVHPTSVIDRLPVVGGACGFEHPAVISSKRRCESAGVAFILGTAAIRWSCANGLLVTDPTEGARWLKAEHLVFAGGMRPSTSAELGLVGDRVAGIFVAPYAYHLMDNGVQIGKRVVVLGSGSLAQKVAKQVALQNGALTMVTADEEIPESNGLAARWWAGWRPISARGEGRVSRLVVTRAGIEQEIPCDAIILATAMRPLRNVDGAVFEDMNDGNVTFVQDASEVFSVQNRIDNATSKAQGLLESLSEKRT